MVSKIFRWFLKRIEQVIGMDDSFEALKMLKVEVETILTVIPCVPSYDMDGLVIAVCEKEGENNA